MIFNLIIYQWCLCQKTIPEFSPPPQYKSSDMARVFVCLGFLQLINLTRRGEEEIFSTCHTNTAASSQVNQLFHVHDHRASAIILPAHNPAMCCRRTFSMNENVTTTEAKPLFYFLALWNRNTHFKCWITIKSVRSSREKSRF